MTRTQMVDLQVQTYDRHNAPPPTANPRPTRLVLVLVWDAEVRVYTTRRVPPCTSGAMATSATD